jgi:hypothetical protein
VLWQVLAYPVSAQLSVIDEWQDGVSVKEASKFEQRIRFLRDRMPADWIYDYAHIYKDTNGLFEIKFESRRLAHRPLCCFGPLRSQFSVLAFAVEHNNNLRPSGIVDTAKNRRSEALSGTIGLIEYDPDQ